MNMAVEVKETMLVLLVTALLASIVNAKSHEKNVTPIPKVEAFFQGHCSSLSPCHDMCIDLPKGGYECACKPGRKLHSNGFSCVDPKDDKAGATTTVSPEKILDDIFDEEDIPIDGKSNYGSSPKASEKMSRSTKDEDDETDDLESLAWETFSRTKYHRPKHLKKDLGDIMVGDDPTGEKEYITEELDHDMMSHKDEDQDHDDEIELTEDDMIDIDKRYKYRYRGYKVRTGKNRNRNRNKNKGKNNKNRKKPQSDAAEPDPSMDNNILKPTPVPIKYHSCSQLRCHAGGRCVPDKMRGGVKCQCKLGSEGEFCERDIVVRHPKFMGTGYIAFPVLRGAYKEFTITIEFRPDTSNGLLLFSAEHPSATADFISISLVDGHAEFRFDCGTGMAQITTRNQVELSQWNTITVHRNDWNGWVQLNGGTQAKGRSKGLFSRITFREDLYLGGFKNTSVIGGRTGMQWGFVGCVKSLKVNNREYDMRKGAFIGDAIHGVDVGECSSHVCDKVKCLNGGTCMADSPDTNVCLCPLGTAGDRCENRIDIHVPSFDGMSYLQYIGLRRTVLSFAEIEMVFKATDGNGVLLYNGFTTDRSGDFISIALVDSYLEFRFDLGTGPAIIRSRSPLTLNEWHVIRVSRTGRDGYLQVDNEAAVEGMSKGAYTQLTLTLDLFIGGHRNFDEVAKHANVHSSFKGCIQKVVINEKPVKLLEEALTGINIDNCNHPCLGQPCLNGGRCEPIRDFYKCSCPLGFENTNCEDRKARREIKEPIRVPMFTGDSHLMYKDPFIMQRIRGEKIDIQIRLRARGPNGLIFWTGEDDMTTSSDFLAVGMYRGHAQFSYNLGSGQTMIVDNKTRLDDGKWHKIHVQRYDKVGMLEVDGGDIVEGMSPGTLTQLNTEPKFYLGGTSDIVHKTLKKYTSGFVGCISNVTLATDYHVDLMAEANDGRNIRKCV